MSNCVYFVLVLFVSSVRKQNKHLTRTVCTQHRSARRALSQSIDALDSALLNLLVQPRQLLERP